MQGAISNIDALERFFRGANAPFFTLSYYSTNSPTGQGNVVVRNVRETGMDQSWQLLRQYVMDQTGYGRAQLHLITYESEKSANTPTARTNIDIVGTGGSSHGTPGIGSLPVGYTTDDAIQKAVDAAKEKWEMEARIQALENQPEENLLEKVERIAAIPVVQTLINAYLQKQGMANLILSQPAVNGAHMQDTENQPDGEDNFDEDIDATARIIGVTDAQLAARLRKLAEENPDVARQIFNQ